MYYADQNAIFSLYLGGWGGLLSAFCPRGQGGGECKMSTWGGGGKIGQKLVYVVVECPLFSDLNTKLYFDWQIEGSSQPFCFFGLEPVSRVGKIAE